MRCTASWSGLCSGAVGCRGLVRAPNISKFSTPHRKLVALEMALDTKLGRNFIFSAARAPHASVGCVSAPHKRCEAIMQAHDTMHTRIPS